MLRECMDHLGLTQSSCDCEKSLLVVDCTLGYGGHSLQMLKTIVQHQQLQQSDDDNDDHYGGSKLIAFDQDSLEICKTEARIRDKLRTYFRSKNETMSNRADLVFDAVNQNFETLGPYLKTKGNMGRVTCLLADLGLSSMQIDDNTRGFTFKREGPLDMRMNNKKDNNNSINNNDNNKGAVAESAYDLLCRVKVKQLKSILSENSDEVFAAEIAAGLVGKGVKVPETTLELAERVRDIVRPMLLMLLEEQLETKGRGKKVDAKRLKKEMDSTVARTMQAIRIEVNGEFRALETLLGDLPDILAPGGRAVFLTFHSGEDRRVKKAFKEGFQSGVYSSWSKEVVRPSSAERRDNPRSSCCKLRWVIRSGDQDRADLLPNRIERMS